MINSSIVISVTFSLDEITVDALSGLEVDPTDGINDAEFWAIEAEFNGVIEYDDRAQDGVDTDGVIINGQPTDEEYLLREKWRAHVHGLALLQESLDSERHRLLCCSRLADGEIR